MGTSPQMIEDLKAAGHYFAAGAVAQSLGGAAFYGCHYGMRSTREQAKEDFYRGFAAAMSYAKQR